MMIESIERLADLLMEKDNILILTHANPDGDTLGSATALCLALRSLGKKANISNSDAIPKKYHYMTDLVPEIDFTPEFVMSVDVADAKLLGKGNEDLYGGKIELAVDHHGTNRLFAKDTYLEEKSASCCEIIFLLIKEMKAELTKEIVDCIFTGCSTDTGCFKYSNVTPRTHQIAAELISLGASSAKINEVMFDTKSFAQLKLQQLCLENLELFFDGRVSLFTITKEMADETGCEESDFDHIVVLSRQIEGVQLGLTLKEKSDGSIKCSARSNDNINAAEFCSAFGGGGHVKAAGCSFNCTMTDAKKMLLEEAGKLFES